jgi:hypothetical protein
MMAMLPDLMQALIAATHGARSHGDSKISKAPDETGDNNFWTPKFLQNNKASRDNMMADPNTVFNDQGEAVDYSNPFSSILKNMWDNSGQGSLFGFLKSLSGGMQPNTGTTPDNFLDNQSLAQNQKQANLAPTETPQPPQPDQTPTPQPQQPVQSPYAQPTALDPVAIEQLRQSLLTDAGQMDPNNPNGLSGRMNNPNAAAEQRQQGNEAMSIEDSVRGFDGVRAQKMKERKVQMQ